MLKKNSEKITLKYQKCWIQFSKEIYVELLEAFSEEFMKKYDSRDGISGGTSRRVPRHPVGHIRVNHSPKELLLLLLIIIDQ